jgi:hypothetical protein
VQFCLLAGNRGSSLGQPDRLNRGSAGCYSLRSGYVGSQTLTYDAACLVVPIYGRGQAYLSVHRGGEAAAEFEKIIGHRGLVVNSPIGALARLALAHAYALQADTAKARSAYEDCLTSWKDADAEIQSSKKPRPRTGRSDSRTRTKWPDRVRT